MTSSPRSPSGARLAWLVVASILLSSCSSALAADRALTLQMGGGVRTFNDQLGLDDAACFSIRAGLGMTERVSLAIDGFFSSTPRRNTRAIANIEGLRGVVRMDLLLGPTRPYLVAGGGGVLFDFSDAWDSSGGVGSIGVGVSRRIGSRTFAALEAGGDFYRSRVASYDATGNATGIGPYTTRHMSTATLSIGYDF